MHSGSVCQPQELTYPVSRYRDERVPNALYRDFHMMLANARDRANISIEDFKVVVILSDHYPISLSESVLPYLNTHPSDVGVKGGAEFPIKVSHPKSPMMCRTHHMEFHPIHL